MKTMMVISTMENSTGITDNTHSIWPCPDYNINYNRFKFAISMSFHFPELMLD